MAKDPDEARAELEPKIQAANKHGPIRPPISAISPFPIPLAASRGLMALFLLRRSRACSDRQRGFA